MEKELCCFFIYSVDRVLRAAASMDGRGTTCSSNDRCNRGKGEEWEEDRNTNREKIPKIRKNFEKPLDNGRRMWYTIGAAREQRTSRSEAREKQGSEGTEQKNLKKV